jgi:hypothetical protein
VAKVGIGGWKLFSILVIMLGSLRNEIIWVDICFRKFHGRLEGVDECGCSILVMRACLLLLSF